MKLSDNIAHKLISSIRKSSGYEIILPNFYVGHYEMDVFRRMKSGYVYEYEIKISRSDFKNDFKKHKSKRVGLYPNHQFEKEYKHECMSIGRGDCNKFFFVVPENLIQPEEVPEHAGLIWLVERTSSHGTFFDFKTIKNAPFIHKNKNDSKKFFENLAVSLSFREVNQRNKLIRMKHKFEELKSKFKK